MKLKFKKQQYQENASLSVVKCFEGQPKGTRQDLIGRREKKIDITNWRENSVEDIISFGNNKILLSGEDLRKNIRAVQKQNNLDYTDKEGFQNNLKSFSSTHRQYDFLDIMDLPEDNVEMQQFLRQQVRV